MKSKEDGRLQHHDDGLVSFGPGNGNGNGSRPPTIKMPTSKNSHSAKAPVPDVPNDPVDLFGEPSPSAGEPRPTQPNVDPRILQEWANKFRAANLQDKASAGYLYLIGQQILGKNIDVDAYVEYRNGILKACGDPQDPVEALLLEQLLMAHHTVGRLLCQSSITEHPNLTVSFANAAARMAGELRRTAVALATYREKSRPVIDETSAVAGKIHPAAQQEPEPPKQKPRMKSCDSKQGSKRNGKHNGEIPQCLKERMDGEIPVASQPAASTGKNGRG